jgi:hypothetical protein
MCVKSEIIHFEAIDYVFPLLFISGQVLCLWLYNYDNKWYFCYFWKQMNINRTKYNVPFHIYLYLWLNTKLCTVNESSLLPIKCTFIQRPMFCPFKWCVLSCTDISVGLKHTRYVVSCSQWHLNMFFVAVTCTAAGVPCSVRTAVWTPTDVDWSLCCPCPNYLVHCYTVTNTISGGNNIRNLNWRREKLWSEWFNINFKRLKLFILHLLHYMVTYHTNFIR